MNPKFIAFRNFRDYILQNKRLFLFLFLLTAFSAAMSVYKSPHIEGNACFNKTTLRLLATNFNFDYYMNCDSAEFLEAGRDFPYHFIDSKIRMSRPGYPAIEWVVNKISTNILGTQNDITMSLYNAIFINFIFALLSVLALYYLTERLFSKNNAVISSILFIFSTHLHIFMSQAHTEIAGNFVIIGTLLLLYRYLISPELNKLFIYSILAGLLLTIKFVFFLPIFISILAIRFKRIKELVIYIFITIIPSIMWYLYVTRALNTDYYSAEVSIYQQGTWYIPFLADFSLWGDLFKVLIYTIILFAVDLEYAFLFIIPLLAIVGFLDLKIKHKTFILFSYITSIILMLFMMYWGGARLAFGLFPIMLPLSVHGLFILAGFEKSGKKIAKITALILLLLVVIMSKSNVYELIPDYNYDNNYIRDISGVRIMNNGWE